MRFYYIVELYTSKTIAHNDQNMFALRLVWASGTCGIASTNVGDLPKVSLLTPHLLIVLFSLLQHFPIQHTTTLQTVLS